jgi:hypothetical protein
MERSNFILKLIHKLLFIYQLVIVKWMNWLWWNSFFYLFPMDFTVLPKKPRKLAVLLASGTRITAHVESFREFVREAVECCGVEELFIYLHEPDYDLQMKSKRLREILAEPKHASVIVKKRAFPNETSIKKANNLEEFIDKNVNSVDLVLTFESCIHLWGLDPLSLVNAEFAHVSWSGAFSALALRASLQQYAHCEQRFGK